MCIFLISGTSLSSMTSQRSRLHIRLFLLVRTIAKKIYSFSVDSLGYLIWPCPCIYSLIAS